MDSPGHPVMDITQHEFACAIIIDTHGRLLFQQRDDIPGIIYPGKIGLFGGHREDNETFLLCVVREVHEEIGYFIAAERFEYLASYSGILPDVEGCRASGEFFIARDVPADALLVTEGSLLIVARDDIDMLMARLTPMTQFALAMLSNDLIDS